MKSSKTLRERQNEIGRVITSINSIRGKSQAVTISRKDSIKISKSIEKLNKD